jgi:hypothetical protein
MQIAFTIATQVRFIPVLTQILCNKTFVQPIISYQTITAKVLYQKERKQQYRYKLLQKVLLSGVKIYLNTYGSGLWLPASLDIAICYATN